MVDVQAVLPLRQLPPHLGDIHPNLLGGPRLRLAILGEQPHGPALEAGAPVHAVDAAGVLVDGVLGPRADRALVQLLVDVGEAGPGDRVAHRRLRVQRPAGLLGAAQEGRAPAGEQRGRGQRAVVGEDAHVELDLFDPATGGEVAGAQDVLVSGCWGECLRRSEGSLVAATVQRVPLLGREGAEKETHVDQIELVAPGPVLRDVVDLEDTVWRDPGCRRRVEVDSMNGGWSMSVHDRGRRRWDGALTAGEPVRYLNSPGSVAGAEINDVLRGVGDRRAEERIRLLAIQDLIQEMAGLHRLKLLFIGRTPILVLPHGLVTSSVLYVPRIHRRGNRRRLAALVSIAHVTSLTHLALMPDAWSTHDWVSSPPYAESWSSFTQVSGGTSRRRRSSHSQPLQRHPRAAAPAV